MPEALAVDRGAAIEEGAEQDRELRCDLLAESCQNIHADDEGDAGDAQQCAGQLQRRERLVARHQQGDEEHETGEVEFSTPASPLSTYCWPQASSVQAAVAFSSDCTKNRRQVAPPRGRSSEERRGGKEG